MPNSSQSIAFTLYDLAGNLNADNEFRSAEAKTAYFIQNVRQDPCVTKITRMTDWIAASFSEPWTSWLYFSASDALEGWIKFGSRNPVPMSNYLRQTEDPTSDKLPCASSIFVRCICSCDLCLRSLIKVPGTLLA
jgi:hypothetical protein